MMDCDEDGILDPVCSDTSAAFGYIGLSKGCRGMWPNEACFNRNGRVCARHRRWCSHRGATFLYQDCDADGIPDPVCSDTSGSFGIIKSSQQCKSIWPSAICRAQGSPGYTCKRHNGWCSHGGASFMLMDCDKDGIPDPVCSDANGSFGIIASRKGCHSIWPHASCQTKKGRVCKRPKGWCSHRGASFMYKDCDGDGIPDPVCADANGNFGVVKSSSGCSAGWPKEVCHSA